MLGWYRYGFDKKRARTRYAEPVFLHLVESAGHVVPSGASGTRNIDALFVMLRWARCCFHKKRTGTRYARLVFSASGGICGSRSAFRCFQAVKHRCIIFFAQVGPVRFPQKSHRDTLHLTCLFTSGGIYWSRSAFWCIRAVKHRRNIFHAWFGLVQFP
jgi:hypothetical protein